MVETFACPRCGGDLKLLEYSQATAQGVGICTNSETNCNTTFWVVAGETPVALEEKPDEAEEAKYLFGRVSDEDGL